MIFFIGDGMGPEQVKAANYFNGGPLSFELFPNQGRLTTYSSNNSVTDSAAAATALATGHKVENGVISEARPANADYPVVGSEMETLLEYYKARGKSTGLVTTTYITHATPAAFGAHEPSRDNTSSIASDYLIQTRPNVLFGGGSNGMSTSAATSAGYTVVTSRTAMQALDTETETMVSGQFGSGYLPYEYDGLGSLPHLSQMTGTALDILDNDPDGFFLMVEGGRIDHAGHSSDILRNVPETIEFGNSVQAAISWAAGRADTLILVAADHETGGLGVTADNGPGNYPSVSWSGDGGHTAANVPVYAWGHGAELISGVEDNTYLFEVATADTPVTLTWDGNGPGSWGSPRWTGYLPPDLSFPNDTTSAVVETNTVTVAGNRSAIGLKIESGGLVIDAAGSLAVTGGVDVAAGAALDVAGSLSADSVTTAGMTTFADGSLGTVDTFNVTDGTTTISSPNVNTVNATGGILNTAADVVQLNVADATVNVSAEITAENVTLAGGTIRVNQNSHLGVTGMEMSDGTLDASGDVTAESVNMTGGSIYLADGADLNVTTMHVTGGAVHTGGGHVVVGSTLKIGKHTTYSITGATFRVNGSSLADPAGPGQLTLGGGRVTIREGLAAPGGAIALWKFEDQDPLTTPDLSTAGNDHVGTLINASRETDDPDHPTALGFRGDGYLEAANTEDLRLGQPFTIAMWIKTSESGVALLGKGFGDLQWRPAEKALGIDGNGGGVSFTGKYCGAMKGLTNVANDEWHHVVVTFATSDDQEIYVDGAKDTDPDPFIFPYTGGLDSGAFFRLGWAETRKDGVNPVYQEYDGLMDNVYVYDRSLSQAEVSDLYDYEMFGGGGASLPNMHVRVTGDSVLCFDATSGEAVLGNLSLDAGKKLEVRGAAVRFRDLIAGNGSSIQGDLSVAGTLSPGDSPGTLNVAGGLAMEADSIYQWELGASAADLVAVDGDLALSDGWTLRLADAGGTCAATEQLELFTYTGSYTGLLSFGSDILDGSQVVGSGRWDWAGAEINVEDNRVYLTGLIVIPEPGTTAPAAIALLGFLAHVWRRRRRG